LIEQILQRLENIDRRIIYLFVLLSVAIPIYNRLIFTPAPLPTSEAFYQTVERMAGKKGKIALISSDWGPNTKAENQSQMEVAIEHLMRKEVPFVITSMYALATPFMDSVPRRVADRLNKEGTLNRKIEYGKDWVNVGYRVGGSLMIQSLAKSKNIRDYWSVDAAGTPLEALEAVKNVKDIQDIGLLLEFTGLTGAFDAWVQFFTADGYTPDFVHGCTSITIPEARTYVSSGQLDGLHEGLAGAAYYEKLLSDVYTKRIPGDGWTMNTGLAFAQVIIIFFIFLGNLGPLYSVWLKIIGAENRRSS